MYYCKIARTDKEFDEIARFNYQTFVEEISQHSPNNDGILQDRFHNENTYILVYRNNDIVGMLAFRDQRPFSLDEKIGNVEDYLDSSDCEKLCEIRLLAVKKQFRNGRVFRQLAKAIYTYVYERNYSGAIISGFTKEEKLYKHLGFTPFGSEVGTSQAKFIPMILTRKNCAQMAEKIRLKQHYFYPGPVLQTSSLTNTSLSHRSGNFKNLYQELLDRLLQEAQAKFVTTIVGSGTLANDAMLGQMKADFQQQKGIILSNGEFGERLIRQAIHWDLQFHSCLYQWGETFQLAKIEERFKTGEYRWIALVHGETSTGECNNLQAITRLAEQYQVKVCVDCISTFGALAFSMRGLYMASAVSGKALGALSGLSFVFLNQVPQTNDAPLYLNLAHYFYHPIPFTIPAFLVSNTVEALKEYPERYKILKSRLDSVEDSSISRYKICVSSNYPTIMSFVFPHSLQNFSDDAKLNGFFLHDESVYLKEKHIFQISTIGPDFEVAFENLIQFFDQYINTSLVPQTSD